MECWIMTLLMMLSAFGGRPSVVDLEGGTLRVTGGDVTIFDGREVRNGRVVIGAGDYVVEVRENGGTCLTIGDNTELIIDGTLRLAPNAFEQYDMIRIVGKGVKVRGKGCLVGDRTTHRGKGGEWGMGIYVRGAREVTLSGVRVKDCWGDCVYVGRKAGRVTIENCSLEWGRRQGISVTGADSVVVRNCTISNVGGTNPQYAIDVEPNRGCSVNYVRIEGVVARDCEGGFRAIVPKGGKGNATIGVVEIVNSHVSAKSRYPIHLCACREATVEGCVVEASNENPAIYSNYVEDLRVTGNRLIVDRGLVASMKNGVKRLVGKGDCSTIRVVHGSSRGVRDNRVVEN